MQRRTSLALALAITSLTSLSAFAQNVNETATNGTDGSVGLVRVPGNLSNLSTQANHLNQNQWIRLTDEGCIRGSVSSLVGSEYVKQGKVRLALLQEGVAVFEGLTDVEGDFIIDRGRPGVYSLVASGEQQLAVCSLTVLDANEGKHLPDRAHIRSLNPVSTRVSELIRSNTMPSWTVGTNLSNDPIADTRSFQGSCDIQIDARGGISGVLSRANASVDLSSTLVYLVRDGKEIARTRAASNGEYRFESVTPGGYGLVVSGPEGIAAIGFSAIATRLSKNFRSTEKLVGQVIQDSAAPIPAPNPVREQLNVELAEPNCYVPADVIAIEECVVCEEAPLCPTLCGCGSFGTGMGGGSGGGGGLAAGGLGGFGSLAAIGSIAAIAVAASDSGDEAPIVSPIQ